MLIKKLYPEIITIFVIIIGALCFTLVARGLLYAPPFLFSGLRTLLAGLSILLILPLLGQPMLPSKSTWKWILIFSIPAVVITYGAMFLSHRDPSMTIVSVLENLQPLLFVFFAVTFLHEKLTSATRIIMIFGILGVIILLVPALTDIAVFSWSNAVLALLASLSAAITPILVKSVKRKESIVTVASWQFIIGSIPLFLLSLLFEKNTVMQFNMPFMVILLFLAVIGTALTAVTWYMLIQKTTVSRVSVLFFLLPAFSLLISKYSYSLPIKPLEWLGMGVIVVGVLIGVRKQFVLENIYN